MILRKAEESARIAADEIRRSNEAAAHEEAMRLHQEQQDARNAQNGVNNK